MIIIRKLALVLFLAFLSTSYSNSQEAVYQTTTAGTTNTTGLVPGTVYSTGNIVQPVIAGSNTSPWVNGVYQPYLQCMYGGQPGNCGPNPSVTPLYSNGYIVFSYGLTDLYQAQSVASVLPSTGLRVNGYNFGFTAKNGSGWDDGRVDTLSAYVSFYGTDGKVKDYTNYDLNSKFDWSVFNYSKDFVSPYAAKDLSTVRYGFVGMDNNFWAGNYGPEIMNVNFSLKYSVDPCSKDPLASPTCSGYLDALLKSIPTTTATSTTTTITDGTQTTTVDTTTGLQVSDLTQPTPPPPGMEPPPGSSPPAGLPPPPGTTQTASSNPASAPANQPPLQGGGTQQPKAGEVKTAGDSSKSSSSPVSLSSVMSMISSNQARIGNEAKAVVQAAESAAAQSATSAQQQAETIAGTAVSQSTSSSTTGTSASFGTTANASSQTQSSAFALPTGQTSTVSSIESIRPPTQVTATETTQSLSTGLTAPTMSYQFNSLTSQSTGTMSTVDSPATNFGFQLPSGRSLQVELETIPQTEGIKMGSRSTLNDAIEQRAMLQNTTTQEQKTDAVNKNVQPNELAGKVDIASIATQPTGYQAYSMMIPDVAFYAPKEIYKNQKNVDNARLLRSLSSDRLHQEMVNQQYKGN